MLTVPYKTNEYPVQSVQDLRRSLENKGILFLELELPRQVGKTTMLHSLAAGYSQYMGNQVLLIVPQQQVYHLEELLSLKLKSIDVISSGRIKHNPHIIYGKQYDVILIDELHEFGIQELVQKLQLAQRTNVLKALVMVRN